MQASKDGRTLIKVTPTDITEDGHFDMPDAVNQIENSAFFNCRRLTQLTLHEGLIAVWNRTFQDCTGLAQVTLL